MSYTIFWTIHDKRMKTLTGSRAALLLVWTVLINAYKMLIGKPEWKIIWKTLAKTGRHY